MAISDLKMKDSDFTGKQVTDLSDNPSQDGVSATDLKEMFVAPSKRVVLPAFNALIELLAGSEGASNIGATQISGLSGYTVQDILEAIKALLDTMKPAEDADREIAQKFDKKEAQALVKTIDFNESNGIFTITKYDGTVQTIDTAIEKVALNVRLEGQQFVLTLVDGTEQRVDLSAFLTQTEVKSSNTITLTITNGVISAQLVAGSVTMAHLDSEVTEYIDGKEASATASATEAGVQAENARLSALSAEASKNAAKTSEGNAKNSEQGAKTSEDNAKTSETNAAKSAEQAQKSVEEAAGEVNKALQEAKESGLFDGKSVTIESISESTEDEGNNVVTFSDGNKVNIKNGSKGATGKTAYEYAKDAGFDGTEDAFSQKLAVSFVTPQMFGAKGDGATDDTDAIQQALDSSSYVYIPDGTYMIYADDNTTGGIKPKSDQTVVLSEKAVLKAITTSNEHYNIINIRDVSNVHICGGKVQGEKTTHNGTTGEWGYGILVNGGQNVTIEKMEISDCWGDAVVISYTSGISKNVKVVDCVLHDCRRQGVSVVGGEYLTIRDCEIYNISGTAPQYGIDIEPDGSRYARNIVIENCYIHDNAVGSIVIANTTNEIKGVNITNCTLTKLDCLGGNDVNIGGCRVEMVSLGATNPVSVANSTINYIYLCGGAGVFDNCDIVSKNRSHLINSTTENYPEKKSDLTCNNCRLSTHDSAQYLVSASNGDGTNGYPTNSMIFVNCSIEIGANCQFSQSFIAEDLRLDGCKIVFKGVPTYVFLSGGNNTSRVIFNNTEVETNGTPSYLFYIGANYVIDFELSNCKFPDTTNFMYEESASSGKIRLFNNKMATTNTRGKGTFEKYIFNSLSDLPKYDGGVA